ncbi:early nodulin-like protein 8 [Apium graveolens]|uniref:Phytocyanin domain-containing protein n=1 Tax=Apium graveolens TaxID=4045 RepID=A0A6L5BBZ1_APIGR|nr:hypothetical protein AG4045_009391 [Apium graveolens]
MGSLGFHKQPLCFTTLLFFMLIQTQVLCYQYKVGDLRAWGLPSSLNKNVYAKWSKKYSLKIGDSLLFLYPPSEDSVVQVTEEAYNSCNIADPIVYMNNGNSVFNITSLDNYYFTSGQKGHCEKYQKLKISMLSGNGSSSAPAPPYDPAASPSYQNVFGSIPAPPSSSPSINIPVFLSVAMGFLVYVH